MTSVVSDNTNMLSFAWLYINACHCVQFLKKLYFTKLVFMRRVHVDLCNAGSVTLIYCTVFHSMN